MPGAPGIQRHRFASRSAGSETSGSPVIAEIVGNDETRQVLWWSLALGADLGGNSTLIGASANIVVAGIAARHGAPIGFWQFTRYGLVVTAVTLAISAAYVWLRYFTLAPG